MELPADGWGQCAGSMGQSESRSPSGGRGVVVAILDTGIAYRNWQNFKESPDLKGTRFVRPYDFVSNNRYPLDQNGHGTFVASTIAEATNNGFGLTGLAYGASIMPVRILDSSGLGDAATISRGIRYAANQGAKVINLSLEFDLGVTASRHSGHHRARSNTRTVTAPWSSRPQETRAPLSSPILPPTQSRSRSAPRRATGVWPTIPTGGGAVVSLPLAAATTRICPRIPTVIQAGAEPAVDLPADARQRAQAGPVRLSRPRSMEHRWRRPTSRLRRLS